MDKYEYKVRSDEIKSLIGEGNYAQAAEIADTIDWRRVKSVMMLCTVSDLYKINRRYEDAKNMLLLAYERRPGGRTICYSLCELCIKTEEFMQALKYYKEFVQVAPKDTGRYILQYKLYEAQEVSLEERIGVLEELKKRDYREKWAYELAYLYHRMGLATRCVEECDELILWFGDGKYVVKAMELKMLHQPLTAAQQEIYDRRFEEPAQEPEQQEDYGEEEDYGQESAYPADSGQEQPEDELDIQVKTVDVGQYNTINLQAELAAGLQEVLGADGRPKAVGTAEAGNFGQEAFPVDDSGEESDEGDYQNFGGEEIEESEVFFGATGELEDASLELETEYEDAADALTEEDGPGTGLEEDYQALEPEPSEWVEEEPRGETEAGRGENLRGEEAARGETEAGRGENLQREEAARGKTEPGTKAQMEEAAALGTEETAESVKAQEPAAGDGGATQEAEQSAEKEAETLPEAQPPREMADVLSQEANGQISMVLPENAAIEKQITGQMKLEDILTEWERIKKENEARCQEEVRKHVLSQTGPMFTEFEATVRDGLLEQLEKGESQENSGQDQAAGPEAALEELTESEEICRELQELTEPEEEKAGPEEPLMPEDGYAEPEEMYVGPKEMPALEDGYIEAEEVFEEPEDVETAEEAAYDTDAYAEPEELTGLEDEYAESEPEEIEPEEIAYDAESEEMYETEPEEEPAYDADTEYPAEDGFGDEAEYIEEGNPERIGFEEAGYTETGEELEYIEEAAEETEIEYAEEPGAEESPVYEEEAVYADESGYEDESEGRYGNEPAYEEDGQEYQDDSEYEAEYATEPEYIEETGYGDESTYTEEGGAVLESEESGYQDGKAAIPEDDIGEEIEDIQEQIEEAEDEEEPGRTARPKTAKTEDKTDKDDKPPIERDQARVRSLTREEKELFAPFIQNRRSREQLVKALDSISMAAYTGNLIITGEEGMDTLTLAKNMMREIRMMDSNFSGKVAKVSGQGLNEKDVADTLRQLNNGALIVQKASGMSSKTAAMLHKQLQHERFGIIVVLEDTEKAMKKLFLGTPDLYNDFTARVNLEALSNDTLVAFGRQYAREKEYSIDNLGVLALHTRIEELQTIDHVVTVMEVKQIVDEAIRRASKKSLGHFFDILLARRYDDEDMVILTEKDFAA